MGFVYLILSWGFGVVFILLGLLLMIETPIAGLVMASAAGLLLPPVRRFAYSYTQYELPSWFRVVGLLVLFSLAGMVATEEDRRSEARLAEQEAEQRAQDAAQAREETRQAFMDNRADILSELRSGMEAGDYKEVAERAREYMVADDEALAEIYDEARARIDAAADRQRTVELLDKLDDVPDDDYERRHSIYEELYELNPDNHDYQVEMVSAGQVLEEQRAAEAAEAARQERIEEQFSSWSGAHRNLERYIKESLHDPDSYDHDETRYVDRGDFLIVRTRFRAANAFGAQRLHSVRARIDLEGNIRHPVEWD